jgi:hypothetical protein
LIWCHVVSQSNLQCMRGVPSMHVAVDYFSFCPSIISTHFIRQRNLFCSRLWICHLGIEDRDVHLSKVGLLLESDVRMPQVELHYCLNSFHRFYVNGHQTNFGLCMPQLYPNLSYHTDHQRRILQKTARCKL